MEIVVILLIVFIGGVIAYQVINAKTTKAIREEQRRQADSFLTNLVETKTLPEIQVNIVLKKGEKGILQEASRLLESRAYRVYGGAGTRIGKIYFGGGASESQQRLKEIDSGTLVLTSERLVFDGGLQTRTTKLTDIVSASAWQDAIEISSSRRQKSQVYSVSNPMIWASMIQNLASGTIKLSNEVDAR